MGGHCRWRKAKEAEFHEFRLNGMLHEKHFSENLCLQIDLQNPCLENLYLFLYRPTSEDHEKKHQHRKSSGCRAAQDVRRWRLPVLFEVLAKGIATSFNGATACFKCFRAERLHVAKCRRTSTSSGCSEESYVLVRQVQRLVGRSQVCSSQVYRSQLAKSFDCR